MGEVVELGMGARASLTRKKIVTGGLQLENMTKLESTHVGLDSDLH
jgi:hypothetical protein